MKGIAFMALAALVLLVGCVQQPTETFDTTLGSAPGPDRATEPAGPAPAPTTGQTLPQASVKEIDVTARRFSFSPDPITVNFGDTVKLNITSADVTHGFSLPDFGINETLPPGQTVTVEFVADKRGTFTFFCSVVCGSGHSEMRGMLVVQ